MSQRESRVDRYPRVSFRLGSLLDEISARGDSSNEVARRDLERYYDLLRKVVPRFEEDEAIVLLRAVGIAMARFTGAQDLSWAVGRMAIRGRPVPGVDPHDLAGRLRDLHPSESLAVVDALEQALHSMASTGISEVNALRQVGLTQKAGRRGRSGGRSGSGR